jgi:hypothetical protein
MVNIQIHDMIMGIVEKQMKPLIDQHTVTANKLTLLAAGHKGLTDAWRQVSLNSTKSAEDVAIQKRKLQDVQENNHLLEHRVSEQSSTIRELRTKWTGLTEPSARFSNARNEYKHKSPG